MYQTHTHRCAMQPHDSVHRHLIILIFSPLQHLQTSSHTQTHSGKSTRYTCSSRGQGGWHRTRWCLCLGRTSVTTSFGRQRWTGYRQGGDTKQCKSLASVRTPAGGQTADRHAGGKEGLIGSCGWREKGGARGQGREGGGHRLHCTRCSASTQSTRSQESSLWSF